MEKVTFDKVVGFLLAVLLALVMGLSLWALLVGEPGSIPSEKTQESLRIVGFAGALAALATWWVQGFAAKRGFVVRFLFALFIFVVAFCSFGGLLKVIYVMVTYPNKVDWSFLGLYFASQENLINFIIDVLATPRAAYAALLVAVAFYIALFGPREPKTVDN